MVRRTYIPLSSILTAQEHVYMGGSPDDRLIKKPEDWYIPQGRLMQYAYSEEEIVQARQAMKVVLGPFAHMRDADGALIQINGEPGFTLESLADGKTVRDPRIVEFERKDKKIVRVDEREDLGKAVVERFKEYGIDLHLRPAPQIGEGQAFSGGETVG